MKHLCPACKTELTEPYLSVTATGEHWALLKWCPSCREQREITMSGEKTTTSPTCKNGKPHQPWDGPGDTFTGEAPPYADFYCQVCYKWVLKMPPTILAPVES